MNFQLLVADTVTQHNASRPSKLQSPEVATVIKAHGAQTLRGVQQEGGSNVKLSRYLNHASLIGGSLGIEHEQGVFHGQRVTHGSRVVKPAFPKPTVFAGCKGSAIIAWDTHTHTPLARSNDKLPLASAVVPDHLAWSRQAVMSLKIHIDSRC